MAGDAGKFEFKPLNIQTSDASVPLQQHLQAGIPKMERRRAWSDIANQPGIRSLLGEKQAQRIDDCLTKGNVKVVEIGGGHLEASKELATLNSLNEIITVEPFVEDLDLLGKPQNLSVIPKAIEDVDVTDIPDGSVDAVFSGGHTLNYIQDKLGCIQRVWKMLKTGGFGAIEYMGQPISPSMQQIIDRFQLNDLMHIETSGAAQVIVVEKSKGRDIDFGKYSCLPLLSGNFPGDVNSYYEFKQ